MTNDKYSMQNILVLNSGSTSVKYKLFQASESKKPVFQELEEGCINKVKDHKAVLNKILKKLKEKFSINAVGHRVVHGGDKFLKPTMVNKKIIADLEKYNKLAPLHNPYNLIGIKLACEFLPEIPQAVVFDTAFYAQMPEEKKVYPIDQKIAKRRKIKKYGFHGISHEFVSQAAAQKLNKDIEKTSLISCHLGGGWSITAVEKGAPINTSMGWTPLEGLVMMSRSGDIDPGIVIELSKVFDPDHVYDLLNKESGIKGLSGGTSDFLELLEEIEKGNERAKLAFNVALNRLIKYISFYFVELGGKVDAIVFTGAIGYGSDLLREKIAQKIKCLGKLKFLPIKTDEELMIAQEVVKIT